MIGRLLELLDEVGKTQKLDFQAVKHMSPVDEFIKCLIDEKASGCDQVIHNMSYPATKQQNSHTGVVKSQCKFKYNSNSAHKYSLHP